MKKRLFAAAMAAAMTMSLLAGCGSSSTTTKETSAPAAENTDAAATDDAAAEEAAAPALDEETAELKMIMISMGLNLEDAESVEAAINEYIEPKIHATIDIEWLDMGDYMNQLNLKLTSGETIDILPTFGTMVSMLYGQEALSDITELCQNYGQELTAAIGEDYLKAGEIGGALYAIPCIQAFGRQSAYMYRVDLAEELGLDFSGVSTLSDLTAIFEQAKAQNPNLTLIVSNNPDESMLKNWTWDGLGDEYGVLMNASGDTTVTNLFATDEYKEYVTLMHEWYEAGYVQADASTSQDNIATLLAPGNALGTIVKTYPGDAEAQSPQVGAQLAAVTLDDPYATTNTVTNAVMTIPTTAENPEKAMTFLNLLYTDPVVYNLLSFGIEGQDYQVVDADNGVVDYLEGENIMTCKYVNKFRVGNQVIGYYDATSPAGIGETTEAFNAASIKSPALGFSYDSAEVSNELAAVSTVAAKYRRGLESGSFDPETELPKFLDELEKAGLDTIIAEKQAQLDAWLAQ